MFQEWYRSSYNRAFVTFLGLVMFVLMSLSMGLFFSHAAHAEDAAPVKVGQSADKLSPPAKSLKNVPSEEKSAPLPPLLQSVQAEYKKSAGIEAQFEQITEIRATKQKKSAQGKIWIKRPNKLRWETLSPDPNILISDGKTFWFYTPPFDQGDRGQVIIKKSGQIQTQFLNALLSGSFEFGKSQTKIEIKGANEFILKPKKGMAGDVVSATVAIDLQTKKIQSVILDHSTGNRTEIKLKEIKLTSALEEKLFHYTPDRNTDKIVE